jgi:hypothetical protein
VRPLRATKPASLLPEQNPKQNKNNKTPNKTKKVKTKQKPFFIISRKIDTSQRISYEAPAQSKQWSLSAN